MVVRVVRKVYCVLQSFIDTFNRYLRNIYNICDQVVSSRDASTEELDRVSVVERSQLGTANRVNTIQVTHILFINITFPYILFVTSIVFV